jgi:hypothetical protein
MLSKNATRAIPTLARGFRATSKQNLKIVAALYEDPSEGERTQLIARLY